MRLPPHPRRGSFFVYALILITILGLYVSSQKILTLDHTISHAMTVFEAQARQGAQSGLNVCLRLGVAVTPPQMVSMFFPTGQVASMAVWYELSGPPGNSQASVTALVFDRNGTLRAMRRAEQRVNRNTFTFQNDSWSRP
ncbi:MAG TPA: hypothetical protein PLU72_16700 [Candidatus Ozemobacteraceae bacterium]|mgnify:CR=1 FL=1|nr:hypothetical protein [Candidatus Ozemobacteraceae bacterium]HQG27276.1 hypothetical protein [Candidatus Ozemobacteraceae bacterium]